MPKCAGTSIRKQLEKYPDKIKTFSLYDSISTEYIHNLCNTDAVNADVWFGHFWFGIHEYIPREVRYITILRNPKEYVLSQYFFRKYTLAEKGFIDASNIFEAIRKHPVFFNNIYTRYLAGLPENVPVSNKWVEQAVHNIDTLFDFVGFNEKMKNNCEYLSKYFNVAIENQVFNERDPNAFNELIDEEKFLEFIHGFIRYDMSVFYYAKGRFDQIQNLNFMGA